MKILFVIKEEDPIDPMNVELLSALAKRDGHETFLNVLQHRNLADTMRKVQPDVIAYSGKTGEHKTFYKANRFVKEAYGDKVFTVMGGPHPTFNHRGIQLFGETAAELPKANGDATSGRQRHVIVERSDLDALCIGEGDDAWVEMLAALQKKRSLDEIPNMVTRSNRKLHPEPMLRERRIDLDDLPYYDRALVYDKTFLGAFPMRSFMSSRGCPFRCTYCFNYDWNKTYRDQGKLGKLHNRYSVDRLIAEIQDWRRMEAEKGYAPTQFIKFYDDMFEFRASPWLVEFAEKFPREVGLPFFCLVRCDIFAHEEKDGSVKLNEEVLVLLKKAGLQSISMSIEAGNNFIRENILVRDMTEKEIFAAFDLMKKYKIGTFANTILGIPAPVIPHKGDPDFDNKLHKAMNETKLAYVVAKKQVEPGRNGGKGYPAELDGLMTRLEAKPDETTRSEGVQALEALGLKHDPIEYDIQSVDINIKCGIHHTMFPRLDPYPGTVITDYTMAVGAFDGNYEKLHSSYDTTSSFTCFTPKQKMMQDNLSFLGQVCTVWPWLWPFARKVLIKLPLTPLYWFMFLVAKTYVIKRYVYPMKFHPGNVFHAAYRVLLVEYKKFFQNSNKDENFYTKPKGWRAAATPTDVLGGRWEA
ncbi:MAG: radical SAM protein [Elusimicrobia bacterium]|nr:radical SAM protein [Elusimicrobiota bacterium]